MFQMPMFPSVLSTLKCRITILFYLFYFSHLSCFLTLTLFSPTHILKMGDVEVMMFKASLCS